MAPGLQAEFHFLTRRPALSVLQLSPKPNSNLGVIRRPSSAFNYKSREWHLGARIILSIFVSIMKRTNARAVSMAAFSLIFSIGRVARPQKFFRLLMDEIKVDRPPVFELKRWNWISEPKAGMARRWNIAREESGLA